MTKKNNEKIITVCSQKYRGFYMIPTGKDQIVYNGTIVRGEWVYGRIMTKRHPYIITQQQDGYWAKRVLIDTISQYTGQLDAQKKEIYEHDIVYDVVPYGDIVERSYVGCGKVLQHGGQWVVSRLPDYIGDLVGHEVYADGTIWDIKRYKKLE